MFSRWTSQGSLVKMTSVPWFLAATPENKADWGTADRSLTKRKEQRVYGHSTHIRPRARRGAVESDRRVWTAGQRAAVGPAGLGDWTVDEKAQCKRRICQSCGRRVYRRLGQTRASTGRSSGVIAGQRRCRPPSPTRSMAELLGSCPARWRLVVPKSKHRDVTHCPIMGGNKQRAHYSHPSCAREEEAALATDGRSRRARRRMGNKPSVRSSSAPHNGHPSHSLLGVVATTAAAASTTTTPGGEPSVRPALSAIPRALLLEPDKLLSARQRQLIAKSWKRVHKTGLDSVGTKIFQDIFAADPSLKKLFTLERFHNDQLKYETRFQGHAHTFTRTMGVIVLNIDDLDSVARYMQELGKRHAQLVEGGCKAAHWKLFGEAIGEWLVEEGQGGRETASAWRLLTAFMIEQMRSGYGERLKDGGLFHQQRAHSCSCPAILSPRDAPTTNNNNSTNY